MVLIHWIRLNLFNNLRQCKSFSVQIKRTNVFVPIRLINIAQDAQKSISNRERKRSIIAYLFVVLPVATFCLGTWQIYRRQWKLDLIAKLESVISSDPVEFPHNLKEINQMEYVKVKVKGYIDESAEPQFIFPRSFIENEKTIAQSALFSKGSRRSLGANIVMPFVVTDKRFINDKSKPLRILVNFGWIPQNIMNELNSIKKYNQNQIKINQPKEIELIGVIRQSEKREPFTTKQDSTQEYWTRRNINGLSEQMDTVPVFLDAYESYPINILNNTLNPNGGQTRINLRNEHLSYIITWYSLTAIFSYLWYKKIFKTRL